MGKNKRRWKKKLKNTAVPTIFSHKKPPNPPRKSSKKRFLNSTPSPLKRSKFIVSEHNYSSKKLLTFDNSDSFLKNDTVIETNNNFGNKTTTNNEYSIEDLLKQIHTLNNTLFKRTKLCRTLRKKINDNNKTRNRIVIKNNKQAAISKKKKFLNENQILSLNYKNTKGFKWTNDTIQKAFRLKFACGSSGYEELLAQNYPLPSSRTLRRRLQNISFKSGILHDVFEMLSIKVSMLNDFEKDCFLVY